MIKNISDLKRDDMFFLLAGPCVIEGEDMALRIAERVVKITDNLHIPYVFKGSYRKANRSRLDSFTGIGDEKALKILAKVRSTFDVPVVTDIHTASEAEMAAEYVDVLQIPAFLCRQTDLLVAAARTGKIVNIKKGQFLSPAAMRFAADKVVEAGNNQVMLTERGTTFGYQDLIVDYRGIPEMQSFGHPVVLDPVGAGASAFREKGLRKLLQEVHPDVIRCNAEEAWTFPRPVRRPTARRFPKQYRRPTRGPVH